MRFRLCCTCGNEEKPKTIENRERKSRSQTIESSPQTVLPKVITQQPKHDVEPIQLDRITELSVEESSVQTIPEEYLPSPVHPVQAQTPKHEPSKQIIKPPPVPAPRHIEQKQADLSALIKKDPQIANTEDTEEFKLFNKYLNSILAAKASETSIPPPVTQLNTPVNQESNIRVDTIIDGEKLTFSQIAPDLYRGTFKGSQFLIIQGHVHDDNFAFNEYDKAAIKRVYVEAMKGMQRGMKELQGGVSALNDHEAWNPPSGSAINTNYFTRNAESAKMTFVAIGKGHFRSTYEGKEFTIMNGKLQTDSSFDEQDRQLILQTYNNTLLGMQQGLMGMQQGMQGMQAMQMNAISSSALAQGGTVIKNVALGKVTEIDGSTMAVEGTTTSSTYSMSETEATAYSYASKKLGTGKETLRKVHSLKHGKRRGLLEGVLVAQSRQPGMVIEDIADEKPRNVDDVDEKK